MKRLFRLVIVVLFLAALGYWASGTYLQQKTHSNVELKDMVFLNDIAQQVVRAQTPQEIKTVLQQNTATINMAIQKGLVTARQIDEFQAKLDEMITARVPDKAAMADKMLKGKVSDADLQKVKTILSQKELGLTDIAALATIYQKAR
jgi:hypothetical protein